MSKIEQIEKLREHWEAAKDWSSKQSNDEFSYRNGGCAALSVAISILKVTSNPKHHYRYCGAVDHREDAKYCYLCGSRL